MADSLDEALRRLAMLPADDALDGIEAAVFARVAAEAGDRARGRLGLATAAGLAVMMGVGGAVLPATGASAETLYPLLPAAAVLAPSSLLAGE